MEHESRKVFIGNIPFETTEAELVQFVSQVGPIKDIKLVCEKDGRMKGVAFCEFASSKLAESAVRNLHETEFHSSLISA